ncbi:MAG: SAM-dependent methyltransferase [Thermodesulfobacteriota bacterium]
MNPPYPVSPLPGRGILLFLTSASVLAYEILLMRLFSLALWYHFAYMVISVALLGFGAAGSFIFLLHEKIQSRIDGCLVALSGLLGVSFSLAFSLCQKAGFDPLNLIWQGREWYRLLLVYLLLACPFLLAGGIVGIILSSAGEKTHLLYGADLLGAGCGALAAVPALYLAPPWVLIPPLGGIVLAGAIGCSWSMERPGRGLLFLLGSACLLAAAYAVLPPVPHMHETKALPMTLSFPDAAIEARKTGPLGMVHGVGSSLIRHVPGLSLHFGLHPEKGRAVLPEQKLLLVDGDAPSAVARFSGSLAELEYLDFTTPALPYHTRPGRRVLIVGGGGGSDVLLGLRHKARDMVVLEPNAQVVELMKGPFSGFSGDLYRRPEVRLEEREARQYLRASRERFDLIQLTLLDSFSSAAGGLHSAAESYLYTTEAFSLYLSRLQDSGIVAVTRWLKLPPRDSFRVMVTALAALRRSGLGEHPERHLLFITSWKTSTILVSRSPFSPEEIGRATRFCDERGFDLAYYAGMPLERANRYDVQPTPVYFLGARALAGPDRETFLKGYVFDVSPTTDDRPYFSHFFRWDRAWDLFRQLRQEWLPMVEMGYLLNLATLAQSLAAGTCLILLPLAALRRTGRPAHTQARPARFPEVVTTILYFGAIGAGFILIEMALLPRYTLLLSHPIYSASVVLSSILVFAGFGSLCVERVRLKQGTRLWVAVGVLWCWVGFHALLGDRLFDAALPLPMGHRVGLGILLLSVLAFFLGWPFPTGLRVLYQGIPRLVPWAWGINGCASVVGAVLGKTLALTFGLQSVMFIACGLYGVAMVAFRYGFTFHDQRGIRSRSPVGVH